MHERAMPLRISFGFCAALFMWAALAGPRTSGASREAPPLADRASARGHGAAQIPPITFIPIATNTPTRTPTPVNIGNFVWDDLDADGRQDAGEPGVAGVTVQLWNAAKTQLLDTDVTNASGFYTLVAPTPGDYRVRVLAPAGDSFTAKDLAGGDDQEDSDINPSGPDAGFTDAISIASNVISTTVIDAGLIVFKTPTPTRTPTPINVGNLVWHDLNGDGVKDAAEPGVAFVRVQLWNGAKTQLIDQDITSASGSYTLVAPTPGQYRVRVLPLPGASFTTKDSLAATDQTDSDFNQIGINAGFTDIYDFASNLISITTIDAGLVNVPASFTPTATTTPIVTNTPTTTPTSTVTPEGTSVVEFALEPHMFMPLVGR